LIAAGRHADAYMVNWQSNVFPGVLGRTCDRPCEPACRRGRVEAMLKLANVGPNDIVYDLGCGDGRMVATAAKVFGARGVGIDIDPERIEESNRTVKEAGVQDRVTIRQEDLFEADIKEATVVTLYLLRSLNLKLRPKLWKELKPGTRIVSQTFDMDDWKPEKQIEVEGRQIYLWRVPATPPTTASAAK
jgi:SAM-dependent methyltransferase